MVFLVVFVVNDTASTEIYTYGPPLSLHEALPILGRLPIRRVLDHAEKVPAEWSKDGGIFIPMNQREAMWIGFTGPDWKPNAVKVEAGRVNAVTGEIGRAHV